MKTTDSLNLENSAARLRLALGIVAALMGLVALVAGVGLLMLMTQKAANAPAGLKELLVLLAVVAVMVGPAALLAFLMLRGEASAAERVIENFRAEKFLVRWSYAPELWDRFCHGHGSHLQQGTMKGAIIIGIGGIAAVAVAMLGGGAARWAMAGVAMGMTVIGVGIGALRGVLRSSRVTRQPIDSIVGKSGAQIGGRLVFWGTASRKLIAAAVVHRDEMTLLEILLAVGRAQSTVLIPVPPGSEALAKKVVRRLLLQTSNSESDAEGDEE